MPPAKSASQRVGDPSSRQQKQQAPKRPAAVNTEETILPGSVLDNDSATAIPGGVMFQNPICRLVMIMQISIRTGIIEDHHMIKFSNALADT